jgi:ATP-dependent protease ClpP protease subunit
MLLFGVAMALALHPPAAVEAAAPATGPEPCLTWLGGRHDTQISGETHRAGPSLFCFDGMIDAPSARSFVEATRGLAANSHPTIVVRSVGGDVDAALTMADSIRRLGATVIASHVCLSSCANYIVGAGARRIVLKDAILGFHGGAQPASAAAIEAARKAQGMAAAPDEIARVARRIDGTYARQQAFLAAAHIDPDLFGWMARFNTLPPATRDRICPGLSSPQPFLVISSEVLARHGYDVDVDDGPGNAAELTDVLGKYGIPTASACFVGASDSRW